MHIAVIGAGAAGLAATRHARALAADDVQVTCFEQTGSIGGTWVYDERIGSDEYGVPISSSMYHNLVTNGAKEVMAYPDVPFAEQDASYLSSAQVLAYLQQFVSDFQLGDSIQLRHQVLRVQPVPETSKWQITVRNVVTGAESTAIYDAVMVCNGHYTAAAYPEIGGRQRFRGQQVHSHDYRRADAFAGKSVLVIGTGPSGIDIGINIKAVAAKVCVSTQEKNFERIRKLFGENAAKPDVRELTEGGARFVDDSEEEFDVILYCTGYVFQFPFLAEECGIRVADGGYHVQPLFKQCVHLERPTMFMIGLTTHDLPFMVMDTQVRLSLALLRNQWQLPVGEELQRILAEDLQQSVGRGYVGRNSHKLFEIIADYLRGMTEIAHLPPIAPVVFKIFAHGYQSLVANFSTFRKEQIRIVDRETFTSRFPEDVEN